MTVATPTALDVQLPPPHPGLSLELETAGTSGAPVALVWAGVACTVAWIAGLSISAYFLAAAAVRHLFG